MPTTTTWSSCPCQNEQIGALTTSLSPVLWRNLNRSLIKLLWSVNRNRGRRSGKEHVRHRAEEWYHQDHQAPCSGWVSSRIDAPLHSDAAACQLFACVPDTMHAHKSKHRLGPRAWHVDHTQEQLEISHTTIVWAWQPRNRGSLRHNQAALAASLAPRDPSSLPYIFPTPHPNLIGSARPVRDSDEVSVHYVGRFADTKRVFDSSRDRGKVFGLRQGNNCKGCAPTAEDVAHVLHPSSLSLMTQTQLAPGYGGVIQGWEIGLASMSVGEIATFHIPSGRAATSLHPPPLANVRPPKTRRCIQPFRRPTPTRIALAPPSP